MIIFLHQGAHSYTHNSLIGKPGLGKIQCRNYNWLLNIKKPPRATYIFTDRERMDLWELRVYGALFQHLQQAGAGYRVINDPARMLNRRSLLRTLYCKGINDFNAYSLTEKLTPKKFPVFLRREHDHAQPLTDLLYNIQELDEALARLHRDGEPDDGVLITEYCAEAVTETLFRKLSAYRVGEQTRFYNCVHEHSWLVKYGTLNSGDDALYTDEQSMIYENAYQDVISKVFSIANIDYGRVDFGLVNGKVQIYEINTNPTTKSPQPHPNPIRDKSQTLSWET
ncbi:MAG: hypothetical protein KAI17_06000 [Thiotrichaceae bacterium]|nr:hypothetical protein [Thiotrichaceae bacterium]